MKPNNTLIVADLNMTKRFIDERWTNAKFMYNIFNNAFIYTIKAILMRFVYFIKAICCDSR